MRSSPALHTAHSSWTTLIYTILDRYLAVRVRVVTALWHGVASISCTYIVCDIDFGAPLNQEADNFEPRRGQLPNDHKAQLGAKACCHPTRHVRDSNWSTRTYIVLSIDVGVSVQQTVDDVEMAFGSGFVQRCSTVLHNGSIDGHRCGDPTVRAVDIGMVFQGVSNSSGITLLGSTKQRYLRADT